MTEINVPARNRAIKSLLLRTYPGVNLSVKAGDGTAYHWVKIAFARRVGNPPGMLHNSVTDAITDLIISAGIHISTYSSDGDYTGKCIDVTMPHFMPADDEPLPTTDESRNAFAKVVLDALNEECPSDTFEMGATTSDCPMIRATFGGERFNITITRARP